jgi:DNA repair protein RecO (recombination protein O)
MSRRRTSLERACLLHHRPYRDTSRITEFVTADHGRVSLFARGVRGPGAKLAAVLRPFAPLLISWSGSADGGTLTGAESDPAARVFVVAAEHFMSASYLNELLLRLLPREDPHPELYEAYLEALSMLSSGEARALRLFEKRLLDALGYGIDYARVVGSGAAVDADRYYDVRAREGVLGETSRAPCVSWRCASRRKRQSSRRSAPALPGH